MMAVWAGLDSMHMFDAKADTFLPMMPPGFNTDASGAYISSLRAWLIEDEDGSLRTSFEIMQSKDTRGAMLSQMKQGGHLSASFRRNEVPNLFLFKHYLT